MASGYSLTTHYGGQGLLDSFSFFTGNDPSNGFVDYQSRDGAVAANLVSVDSDYNSVRLGVDSNSTYTASDKGRPSVRLTSPDAFTHGLFIADIYHMPASTCGSWPAFWAFNDQDNGNNWPVGGELEIIEGANTAQRNLFSAHTTAGCQAPTTGFTGDQGRTNCSPGRENIGCNYASPTSDTTSYGDAFNAEGGGVYALEWDFQDLKLWHFPRSTIPDDIVYGHVIGPDPSSWGPPQAIFGGSSCNPDTYFFNMSLVFNINFCGDYAGNVWGKTDQCNLLAPTCEEFVAGNPNSFQETYWDINFVDVYQYGPLTNMTIPPLSSDTTSSSVSASSTAPAVTPTHTRTITLSTVPPTETGDLIGPMAINGHRLLRCFGSSTGFKAFSHVASSPAMDSETCVQSCVGRKYAGMHDDTCYCADTLGDANAVDSETCDRPCPGNGRQACGGLSETPRPFKAALDTTVPANVTVAALHDRRVAYEDVLFTIYGNLADEPIPQGAPAMGGGFPVHVPPHHNVTKTSDLTVIYTTICSTNPASLVEVEYHTTVTYEDCDCTKHKPVHFTAAPPSAKLTKSSPHHPAPTAVPMTTCTETCKACGPHGESTVTLTVPVAVHTKEVVVTAIAVHTVVPVVSNASTAAYGTAAFTPGHGPKPTGSNTNMTPVVAGAPSRSISASVVQMLGCGVTLWFGLFGAMLVL
ncbi:glycoside hydrolase family 16 protein [Hypoxylon sp. NC1633]|nr:glycoside hydrolase family 16 protein [Hypoxylon sp. NC1633]